MDKFDKKLLNYSQYFVLVTSIIYFAIKYFFQVEGEWGIESHPLEKTFQHIHILTVPVLFFAVAAIFKTHIWKKIRTNFQKLRKTGILMLISFFLMVFSGYGIQVAMNEALRKYLIWLHLGISLLWSVLYIYHQVKGSRIKTR